LPLFRRGESASTLDLLAVGLGNPGRKHARDRHNIGFMVVDELARRAGATFKTKFNGRVGEARVGQARVALLKPETFMNESGRSVQPAIAFYKTPLDRVLVVHDEVDLDHGRLQVRLGGGLAGHNGLRSIAGRLSSPEFLRLRVGVGRPGGPTPGALATAQHCGLILALPWPAAARLTDSRCCPHSSSVLEQSLRCFFAVRSCLTLGLWRCKLRHSSMKRQQRRATGTVMRRCSRHALHLLVTRPVLHVRAHVPFTR